MSGHPAHPLAKGGRGGWSTRFDLPPGAYVVPEGTRVFFTGFPSAEALGLDMLSLRDGCSYEFAIVA